MLSPFPRLYRTAVDALRLGNRVFVIAHRDPDGDAVASVLAAGHLLHALGKDRTLAMASPAPATFRFLPGFADLKTPEQLGTHDTVLVLDVGDIERSNIAAKLAARQPDVSVVYVDHHSTARTTWEGTELADITVLDRRASSTCEMVYRLFEAAGIQPSRAAAQCLLTGIVTDTGMLQNDATSSSAIEILGELMARGASLQAVLRATFRNKSLAVLKLWGRALSRLTVNRETGILSTVLLPKDFEECGVTEDNASEGLSNFLLGTREAPITLVVRDRGDGMVKASFRTNDPTVNVAELARKYGGGGHPKAAGFAVPGKVIETESGYAVVPA